MVGIGFFHFFQKFIKYVILGNFEKFCHTFCCLCRQVHKRKQVCLKIFSSIGEQAGVRQVLGGAAAPSGSGFFTTSHSKRAFATGRTCCSERKAGSQHHELMLKGIEVTCGDISILKLHSASHRQRDMTREGVKEFFRNSKSRRFEVHLKTIFHLQI